MAHQAPSRGVMDGIKKDLQKAKDGEGYKPNGVGNAYSHNFLNQKPWHPANFKNQAKVYEAQQQKIEDAKRREIAKAEFRAEQEYLQTLSFLGPEEQTKFRERQGVQFMYMKPPGMDAMAAAAAPGTEAEPPGGSNNGQAVPEPPGPAAVEEGGRQHRHSRAQEGKSHVGDMLGAVRALQNHEKYEVKHISGMGRSPPRGEGQANADNQQFLASSPEASEAEAPAASGKRKRSEVSAEKLAEAEAVLRQAGIDVDAVRSHKSKKYTKDKSHKKKKQKKHKKSK